MQREYNDAQWRAVAFIPRVTGFLSVIGSSLIINNILSDWKTKLKIPYHRILLCMSIMDVIGSVGQMLSTYPIPSDNGFVYGAAGNIYTCTVQGSILCLGLAVPLYNLSLSFHYVFSTINKNMYSRLEPIYHFLSLGIPLILTVVSIVHENFNNLGSICFINEHPIGCLDNPNIECTRGSSAKFQKFIIMTIVASCFLLIPINMSILFCLVSNQHRKITKKYNRSIYNTNESFKKKEKVIATQAFMYFFSFLITFIWSALDGVLMVHAPKRRMFALTVCAKIFYPMQGFFNFLIFIRPRVMRIKKENPHACYLTVLQQSLLPKISSYTQRKNKYDCRVKGETDRDVLQNKKPVRRRDSLNIIDFDLQNIANNETSLVISNGDSSLEMDSHQTTKNAAVSIMLEIALTSDEESIGEKNIDSDLEVKNQSNDSFNDEITSVRKN